MKYLPPIGPLLSLLFLLLSAPAPASELASLVPGHWLEVRGQLDEHGMFKVQRVDLIQPQNKEEIVGPLGASSHREEYRLLGQRVQLSRKTRFRKVNPTELSGAWVKVSGQYRGPERFVARSISARQPGRQRITGPVRRIKAVPGGYLLTIMNFELFFPEGMELRRELPLEAYSVSSQELARLHAQELSEEDQFGEGVRLGKGVRLATILETRLKNEGDYDLDETDKQDRRDLQASVRARLVMEPGEYGVSGQLEYRYAHLRRKDDGEPNGTIDSNEDQLGESFLFFDDPFEAGLDVQAGRMDFDDRREWVYDQDLDGLRAYWDVRGVVAELSATTTLTDGDEWDENTDNYMIYVADQARRYAGYIIQRDTSKPYRQKLTHYGLRAFVNWPRRHESWLELSAIHGRSHNEYGKTELRGWGFDIGTTRELSKRWFLTGGWAFGSGDGDVRDGSDNNFRQTGLQDNNGKFAGVTSFRYYGELMDPELANLHIGTLGLGYNFARNGSLDLVGHYYRQDKAARKLVDADLDGRTNSRDKELGWELDAVLGWRPVPVWDLEVVLGWFQPGQAFEDADHALLSKLQLRYRY